MSYGGARMPLAPEKGKDELTNLPPVKARMAELFQFRLRWI